MISGGFTLLRLSIKTEHTPVQEIKGEDFESEASLDHIVNLRVVWAIPGAAVSHTYTNKTWPVTKTL